MVLSPSSSSASEEGVVVLNTNSNEGTTEASAMVLPGQEELRAFLDQLTSSTNVSNYIPLPMICVMGDTSSGKSSLLSQLCMVELPSSHELTTKCPVVLSMHQAPECKATIDVQWKETDTDSVFEMIQLNNNDEQHTSHLLADAILKAQEFILTESQKPVSCDVVQVHVYGPHCFDLTICDLPGMVRTRAAEESESLVQDVQKLLESFISNPRCILLAAVPANVDFHNSASLALPYPDRTIPVILKPDLIDVGAETQVVELLLGKKLHYDLGFHICKGRGQAQLDAQQSLSDCIQQEEEFFNTVEPWKSLEQRDLMGTVQLRTKLGHAQMKLMRDMIPDVLQEIHAKQQTAFQTLVEMGSLHHSVADKRRYYQDYCQAFCTHLQSTLSGKGKKSTASSTSSAAAKLHDACSVFMNAIRQGSLATITSIVEGAQVLIASAKGDVRGEVVHVTEKYACVDYVDEKDHTVDCLFDYVGYKSKEPLDEDDVWSDGSKVFIARKNDTFDLLQLIPLHRIRTDPSWLQAKIAENRTDDLACFLNVDIFKSIVSDFMEQDWRPHCTTLLHKTTDIVLSAVSESLQKSYIRYPKLHGLMKQQASHAARALLLTAEQQVQAHLRMEEHPYTQDDVLLEHISNARHACLKRDLEVALRLDQESSSVYDTAAIQSIMDSVFDRNRRKTVEEHQAHDMEIVLEAYGKVSTKRVIDRTPMICWQVFRSLLPKIQEALWNITDEELEKNMAETTEFQKKHRELTMELEEMNKALNIFQSLV